MSYQKLLVYLWYFAKKGSSSESIVNLSHQLPSGCNVKSEIVYFKNFFFRLLLAEKNGKLCRDETVEGLRFFPNLFLSAT